jgi:hypothetical protein
MLNKHMLFVLGEWTCLCFIIFIELLLLCHEKKYLIYCWQMHNIKYRIRINLSTTSQWKSRAYLVCISLLLEPEILWNQPIKMKTLFAKNWWSHFDGFWRVPPQSYDQICSFLQQIFACEFEIYNIVFVKLNKYLVTQNDLNRVWIWYVSYKSYHILNQSCLFCWLYKIWMSQHDVLPSILWNPLRCSTGICMYILYAVIIISWSEIDFLPWIRWL